jgi:hypothetical protein
MPTSQIEGYQVVIESSLRISGSTADFIYRIPTLLSGGYDRVCLEQAHLPKSWYICPAGNTFMFIEDGVETLKSLPMGNYSLSVFLATIKALITSTHASYTIAFPGPREPQTGRLTFAGSYPNRSGEPSYGFRFGKGTIAVMFGFAANSTVMAVHGLLQSTAVIQLSSNPVLMLRSSLVTGQVLHPITGAGDVDDFGWISYNWTGDASLTSKTLAHTGQDTFRFWLTDASADSNLIDLNGLPITLVLIFYKHDDLSALQRQSLMLQHLEQLPGGNVNPLLFSAVPKD